MGSSTRVIAPRFVDALPALLFCDKKNPYNKGGGGQYFDGYFTTFCHMGDRQENRNFQVLARWKPIWVMTVNARATPGCGCLAQRIKTT